MRHLMIIAALLSFVGLDLIFASFSDTPGAALTFAVLAYVVLLLLSVSAGSFADEPEDYSTFLGPMLGPGLAGFLVRVVLASFVPVVLVLAIAFIPDLDNPADPNEAVALGTTLAIFWMFGALAVVGAVLGFIWPRTGAFEAVVAGGLVVLAQSLVSWARIDASREALQLALYSLMVWVSICLIGAWVGLILRQISDFYLHQARGYPPAGDGSLPVLADPEYAPQEASESPEADSARAPVEESSRLLPRRGED